MDIGSNAHVQKLNATVLSIREACYSIYQVSIISTVQRASYKIFIIYTLLSIFEVYSHNCFLLALKTSYVISKQFQHYPNKKTLFQQTSKQCSYGSNKIPLRYYLLITLSYIIPTNKQAMFLQQQITSLYVIIYSSPSQCLHRNSISPQCD